VRAGKAEGDGSGGQAGGERRRAEGASASASTSRPTTVREHTQLGQAGAGGHGGFTQGGGVAGGEDQGRGGAAWCTGQARRHAGPPPAHRRRPAPGAAGPRYAASAARAVKHAAHTAATAPTSRSFLRRPRDSMGKLGGEGAGGVKTKRPPARSHPPATPLPTGAA
jgi:hypothetical protein